MSDLIERLRQAAPNTNFGSTLSAYEARQAADEITALRERVAVLEEALRSILGGQKSESGTWTELVEPLVARFDVAASFGGDAVHNSEGSAALAELLRQMGSRLDASVRAARAHLLTPESDNG